MARTASLLITATLLVCILPLFPSSNLTRTSSQVAATNSTLPHRRVWIDTSAGILPLVRSGNGPNPAGVGSSVRESTRGDPAAAQAASSGNADVGKPSGAPAQDRSGGGEPVGSWESARQFLRSRGIERFRLEAVGQPPRYRFTCWVPLDGNPFVTRQFVGEGGDELAAVWRAIAEIEAWEKQ